MISTIWTHFVLFVCLFLLCVSLLYCDGFVVALKSTVFMQTYVCLFVFLCVDMPNHSSIISHIVFLSSFLLCVFASWLQPQPRSTQTKLQFLNELFMILLNYVTQVWVIVGHHNYDRMVGLYLSPCIAVAQQWAQNRRYGYCDVNWPLLAAGSCRALCKN